MEALEKRAMLELCGTGCKMEPPYFVNCYDIVTMSIFWALLQYHNYLLLKDKLHQALFHDFW